jgi:hypothetical protein
LSTTKKSFWKCWFYLYQNWSSYSDYGKITNSDPNWTVTCREKMKLTNNAKFMHCLPVRRNVVVTTKSWRRKFLSSTGKQQNLCSPIGFAKKY